MFSGLIRVMCADPSGIVGSYLNLDWQSLDDRPCLPFGYYLWRRGAHHHSVEHVGLRCNRVRVWCSGIRYDEGSYIDTGR